MVLRSRGYSGSDVEDVLDDLWRITQEAGDAAAHADLAMAFAEMGMHGDALRQGARVLLLHQDSDATRSALRTVLGPRLMRTGGLAALRRALFPA